MTASESVEGFVRAAPEITCGAKPGLASDDAMSA
jgi:hypothetical protein